MDKSAFNDLVALKYAGRLSFVLILVTTARVVMAIPLVAFLALFVLAVADVADWPISGRQEHIGAALLLLGVVGLPLAAILYGSAGLMFALICRELWAFRLGGAASGLGLVGGGVAISLSFMLIAGRMCASMSILCLIVAIALPLIVTFGELLWRHINPIRHWLGSEFDGAHHGYGSNGRASVVIALFGCIIVVALSMIDRRAAEVVSLLIGCIVVVCVTVRDWRLLREFRNCLLTWGEPGRASGETD